MFQPQQSSTPNTSPTSTNATTSLRQLTWDNSNHISVLTQLNGSVWPKVWPYCVMNILLTSGVFLLHHQFGWHGIKTSSTDGHKYLAMIMSFLVVTRVKILYDRYMHQSAALQECLRCTRELVVLTCSLTATDTSAQAYRNAVATQALRLLSVTMQVLQMRTAVRAEQYAKERSITRVPESLRVFPQSRRGNDLRCSNNTGLFPMSPRMLLTEACRAPVHAAYQVRATILSHRAGSKEGHVLAEGTLLHPCNEEMRLLDAVATFLKSFAVLEQNMSTVRSGCWWFTHSQILHLQLHWTLAHSLSSSPNGQDDIVRVDLYLAIRLAHGPTRHALEYGPRVSHYVRVSRIRMRRHGTR